MKEKLLSPEQFAEKWGVHITCVYGRTRESGPDAMRKVKFLKYIRFVEADVMEWWRLRNERGLC